MAAKFPRTMLLRFSNDDMAQMDKVSTMLKIPRATLIRHAWRQWAKAVESMDDSLEPQNESTEPVDRLSA